MLARLATALRRALTVALALIFAAPTAALAAEPVYPKGSSIGLVPPPGFSPATTFAGFQDSARNASIVVVEMPVEAYDQIAGKMSAETFKPSGFVAKGDGADWPLDGAKARILRGTQTANGLTFTKWVVLAGTPQSTAMVTAQVPEAERSEIPDAGIEAALRSIVFRAPGSLDDQVAALPFAIGDKVGLRVVRTIAGSGLYLTEGPLDTIKDASQPIVIVASNLGQAPPPESRIAFARNALAGMKLITDIKIAVQMSEVAGPVEWARIEGTGRDAGTGTPLHVVQVVRFEGPGYVRIVGLSRQSDPDFAKRTRRLAASVTLR